MFRQIKPLLNRIFSQKYLLITNTVCCSCLLGAGDLIQQKLSKKWNDKTKDYDLKRTARFAIAGIVLGPMTHYWYKWLDGFLPGNSFKTVLKKIAFDQASCPVFSFVFISTINVLEGQKPKAITTEYAQKFKWIYALDWLVWPPTQMINFLFLPPQARVVYVGVVQIFYNTCLSYIKHEMD